MREPTEMEQRCIDAAFDALPGKLHLEDAYALVRAVIREMRRATPGMLTALANLVAPDDLPEGVAEHPRRISQSVQKIVDVWGAAIDAASPEEL